MVQWMDDIIVEGGSETQVNATLGMNNYRLVLMYGKFAFSILTHDKV